MKNSSPRLSAKAKTPPAPLETPKVIIPISGKQRELLEAEEKAGEEVLALAVAKMRERLYRGSEITSLPPTRWHLHGWLQKNSLIALAAPPKAGKSFVALHLASQASLGGSFAGEDFETPLKVLYLSFEKYQDTRDRIEALEQRLGSKLPKEFFSVYAPQRAPQLSNLVEVSKLERLFQEEKPELVIVDTLARCIGDLDENSASDTSKLVEVFDRLRVAADNCCLLFLHHEGKDSTRGMRGSSNLLAAVDTAWKLSGSPSTAIELSISASNASEPPEVQYFKVVSEQLAPLAGDIEERSVGVIQSTTIPEVASRAKSRVVEILTDIYPDGATTKKIVDALNENRDSREREYKYSTTGKLLTSLTKQRVLLKGSEKAPLWKLYESASFASAIKELF